MKETVIAATFIVFWLISRDKIETTWTSSVFPRSIWLLSGKSVTDFNCQPAVNKATTSAISLHLHEIWCSGLVITGDNIVILGQVYYLSTQWFVYTNRKANDSFALQSFVRNYQFHISHLGADTRFLAARTPTPYFFKFLTKPIKLKEN